MHARCRFVKNTPLELDWLHESGTNKHVCTLFIAKMRLITACPNLDAFDSNSGAGMSFGMLQKTCQSISRSSLADSREQGSLVLGFRFKL